MGFKITRLQSCLMSLGALKLFLGHSLKSFKAISRDDTRFVLGNYILINVHSFNQEWKRFESFAKTDSSVRETCLICKPATDKIRYWKGLSQLRSKVLAHEMYDKDDQSLIDYRKYFGDKKAPIQPWEQALLGEVAVYAISAALTRHDDLHKSAQKIVAEDNAHELGVAGVNTYEGFSSEADAILQILIDRVPQLKNGMNTGRDIDL